MTDEMPIRRRLAAILAADIAGYSRLMGEDEAATVRDLKAHQAAVLPRVAQHGGRIIDTAGDGLLAEFPSVTDATACALEIQAVMAERNEAVPEQRRMRFRMGINLGDVIFDDSRIYGDGINVAARLEGLAEPAGILVSHAVYEQVQHRLQIGFDDLGEQALKNIARPVRVYRVRMGVETANDRTVSVRPTEIHANVPGPGSSSRAVFLSYASQDAGTARQIAESLRAVGIEVWFDQAELEGGDAWDRKIRRQIQSCALFVPIISPNTERRPEGYFRLEWWLAEQRSFRMARGLPFLFPVTLDVAATDQAKVPEAFNAVQWTRLDGGQIPADFAARVKALLTGGAASRAPVSPPAPAPDDKSIAVLAFVNLSSDKDNEYFSEGIAEELLNLLAQIPQLKVIARTSSFSFKGKDVAIPEIARQLGVAHVLEGSVRKAGNRVRITAQLSRGAESAHLWSANYDRTLDDIFAVQDEIAAAVVEELKLKLLGAVPKAKESDPEAYALYLQARAHFRQFTPEGLTQAIALAQQALARDPGLAAAWDQLSIVYSRQAGTGLRPVEEGYALAREAAHKALALDPGYALAHASLGLIAMFHDGDLAQATRHMQEALTLAPRDATVLGPAAMLALSLGRREQAITIRELAVARDPANPFALFALGIAYHCAHRPTDAEAVYRRSLQLAPGYIGGQNLLGLALLAQGQKEAALEETLKEPDESCRLMGLATVYHALGRQTDSDAALAELIAKHADKMAYNIAYVLADRGDADRAFEWLDKAVVNRDPGLTEIVLEPLFANIHNDPRWLPFLRKINMAPEQLAAIPFEVKLPA